MVGIYGYDPEKHGIDGAPVECPHCGSTNFQPMVITKPAQDGDEISPDRTMTLMVCHECTKRWIELYMIEAVIKL
jgi:hypothetical protein